MLLLLLLLLLLLMSSVAALCVLYLRVTHVYTAPYGYCCAPGPFAHACQLRSPAQDFALH